MEPLTEHVSAFVLSLAIAVVYLAIVRFVDVNEREPLWSAALVFLSGAVSAALVALLVRSPLLHLTVLPGAVAEEVGKFAALLVAFGALTVAARLRGWSEINGAMDGIVYGVAAGLGYATGETLLRELRTADAASMVALGAPRLASFGSIALEGLKHGLFTAVSGAGLAAASLTGGGARVGLAVAGLGTAVAVNAAYRVLAYGSSLEGMPGAVRLWVALLLPLALVAVVAGRAFGRERRAIVEELSGEIPTGAVTSAELDLLRTPGRRKTLYLRELLIGRLSRWAALNALHNRQVQLALTLRRARGESDDERRADLLAEAERLRASALESRRVLGRHPAEARSSGAPGAAGILLAVALAAAPGALAQGSEALDPPPHEWSGGSLRGRVPQRVGDYVLTETAPLPDIIATGAVDALQSRYETASGARIVLLLAACPSLEFCEREYGVMVQALLDGGTMTAVEDGVLRDGAGLETGRYQQLSSDQGEIVAFWDRLLLSSVAAPGGGAAAFVQALFENWPF
jgi:RsiW-degrading membrane proteinase PrsW (M82 family)